MSPYLLDTSTILWALGEPALLSGPARKALKSGTTLMSVASYWEVVIKSRRGLLAISDPVSWWERATDLMGSHVLSIRASHISALAGLPDLHKDPFDRMLIAQSAAEGFTLLTSDAQIRRYPVRTLW